MRKKLLLPAKLGEGKLSFWHFWDDKNNKIFLKLSLKNPVFSNRLYYLFLKETFIINKNFENKKIFKKL